MRIKGAQAQSAMASGSTCHGNLL